MSREVPIEIMHLPVKLREAFTGRLPEAAGGSANQREANFLSRALAAYAIYKLAGCTLDDAAGSVVDGGGDGGIDGIHYSAETSILFAVQSKYFMDGYGEPDLGAVSKFRNGIENLLLGRFDAFSANEAWGQIVPQLEVAFRNGALAVRAVLVYSGINVVSEDRLHLFEGLLQTFSPDEDYLKFQVCNLTTVHDWVTGADQGPGVAEAEVRLRKPGWIREPYETVYGLLPLDELSQLYAQHGKRLIGANIRGYKGDTDVNDQILGTIKGEPQHFFYLNNGLTAYCERLEVNNLDRGNAEQKRIRAFGFSIVNGAQTLGSVAEHFAGAPDPPPHGYVFLKVISLERCNDDREFADRITRSTNFQNQIGMRDFVALDPQQERIANQLILSGITYHYKDDADTPPPDEANFTLEEATSACACLAQMKDCDFCCRVLANRKSLWSFEPVYPESEAYRSRYHRVFRPDMSARTIWRAVQTQRRVKEAMTNGARSSAGIRRAFFENSRWLLLNVVFLILHSERGEALTLSAEDTAAISRCSIELAEALWSVCESQGFVSRRADNPAGADSYEQPRHFRSVFSSPADCQRLRDGLLAGLAGPAQSHANDGSEALPQ